jgi:hypothetical protein
VNSNRWLQPFPKLETGLSERGTRLVLSAGLLVGLTFITPLLSIALGVPALVFVVLIGGLYGVGALLVREVPATAVTGIIVTAPFAANVPLTDAYAGTIASAFGTELWLVHVPLVLAVVVILGTDLSGAFAVTRAEALFAGFVGWSVLAALFGATVRTDIALLFSLFMAQVLVVIGVFRYAVQHDIVRFRTIGQVFAGTVAAQALFAVAQFVNRGTFGVSTLGESGEEVLTTFSLGPFGTVPTGTYVSGFTGGQFILGSLLVLAVPVVFAFAIKTRGWRRGLALLAAVVMVAIVRATAGDAARGGLLVAGVLFAGVAAYRYWDELRRQARRVLANGAAASTADSLRNGVLAMLTAVLSFAIALYPSASSGASSVVTTVESDDETATGGQPTTTTTTNGTATGGQPTTTTTTNGTATGGQPTTTASTDAGMGAGGGVSQQSNAVESLLQDLSIPFFSLSNLGVRLEQYVAGLGLFVQHPLFGIGGANFIYYSTALGVSERVLLHNIYIAVLAETGLVGFLLFVGFLVAMLWAGVRVFASREHGRDRLLVAGVCCGLVGYLAYGFFDHLQLTKPTAVIPFALLVGAVLGQYRN